MTKKKQDDRVLANALSDLAAAMEHANKRRGQSDNGFAFSSVYDYVLYMGRRYEPRLMPASDRRFYGKPKTCYSTALRYALHLLQSEQCVEYMSNVTNSGQFHVSYVEGFTLDHKIGIPIQHAWVGVYIMEQTSDGLRSTHVAYDPTWEPITWRDPLPHCEYYGVRFSPWAIASRQIADGCSCSVVDDYTRGFPLLRHRLKYHPGLKYGPCSVCNHQTAIAECPVCGTEASCNSCVAGAVCCRFAEKVPKGQKKKAAG